MFASFTDVVGFGYAIDSGPKSLADAFSSFFVGVSDGLRPLLARESTLTLGSWWSDSIVFGANDVNDLIELAVRMHNSAFQYDWDQPLSLRTGIAAGDIHGTLLCPIEVADWGDFSAKKLPIGPGMLKAYKVAETESWKGSRIIIGGDIECDRTRFQLIDLAPHSDEVRREVCWPAFMFAEGSEVAGRVLEKAAKAVVDQAQFPANVWRHSAETFALVAHDTMASTSRYKGFLDEALAMMRRKISASYVREVESLLRSRNALLS